MGKRFDYFVVFAEMRTGSNFLEENLNDYPGLVCMGEAFNPHFVGGPNKPDLLGVTLAAREADPLALLDRMRVQTDGLPGFRFFHDHDSRILAHCLPDPRSAKIILTRNPLDSYVSRKIAAVTGQWRLNDLKRAKSAQITFDIKEFEAHIDTLQEFQLTLMRGLQTSGQAGFYIAYDDLQDIDVLNGLARFLGVEHQKKKTSQATKVQNPESLEHKVINYPEMEAALARIDRFDLSRTPNFEPRRAPAVPTYVAAAQAPLLYQPVRGGPDSRVLAWLAALDGVAVSELQNDFTQKSLRQWKRRHKGHRTFTVIQHPVARLHGAFVRHILGTGPAVFADIQDTLRKHYNVPIPVGAPGKDYTAEKHKAAFLAFIRFVTGNLNGQTSIRVDGSWGSQAEILRGMSQVQSPDMVLREDDLDLGLRQLADQVGLISPGLAAGDEESLVPLASIYDDDVESAVRGAYQRDYLMFGFRPWKKT